MEVRTTQDCDVVAVGVVQGERGSVHEATILGRRYFPALEHYTVNESGVKVTKNDGNGLCAYHALVQGARGSLSQIAGHLQNVQQLKKTVLARCFSWVTGTCTEALASACCNLPLQQALTASQVASLKAVGFPVRDTGRQSAIATIGSLRDQMIEMVQLSEWTPVSTFSFASHVLERNIAVWERSHCGSQLILYSRKNEVGLCNGLFLFRRDSKTIHILFSHDGDNVSEDIDGRRARGGNNTGHFEYIELPKEHEDEISKRLASYVPGDIPPPSHLKPLASCGGVQREEESSSTRCLPLKPYGLPGERGGDECDAHIARGPRKGQRCGARSKPKGSGRCGKHQDKSSKVPRHRQPDRPLRAPEAVNGDDDFLSDGEAVEDDDLPVFDLADKGKPPVEASEASEERSKVIANAKKIKEMPYRNVFEYVHGLHVGKDTKHHLQRLQQWTSEGMGENANDDVFQRTKQLESSKSSFTPTKEALEHFPAVTLDDINSWELEGGGKHSTFCQRMSWSAFQLVFPEKAVNLIVNKTNDYHDLCRGKLAHRKAAPGGRHEKNSSEWSGQKWPDGGIGKRKVLAMLGLLIHMGVVKLPRMEDHWSADPFYDFQIVRNCMPRDFFFLMYSRFFHVADSVNDVEVVHSANGADVDTFQLAQEYEDSRADKMHQIRGLQEILNDAWSTVVHVAPILALDEQMVLDVSRAGSGIQKFNDKKPIKRGLKRWAVADQTGWCYVCYTDVGMKNDPKLAEWQDDPLGHITRVVLFVMLAACTSFAQQLEERKVFLALDNLFTSPTLLLCLAHHNILAFGTVRKARIGVSGAFEFWASNHTNLGEKGTQRFARTADERYPIAVTEWRDSRDVLFASTAHIFDKDTRCLHYERLKKGGDPLESSQPTVRASYNSCIGGVDVADQRCESYLVNHKPKRFFWRRVFDQSLFTALTNAELLYRWWVTSTLLDVGKALKSIGLHGEDDDTVQEGPAAGLTRLHLKGIERRLLGLSRQLQRSPTWKKELGKFLMVKYRIERDTGSGHGAQEKLKSAPTDRKWYKVLPHGRACNGPECSASTKGACRCAECRDNGDGDGVVICQKCFWHPE